MKTFGRLLAIAVVGAVAIVVFAWYSGFDLVDARHLGTPRNYLTVDGENLRVPKPEGPSVRVLSAVPVATSGAYSFMFVGPDGQTPVRFDPCRAIAWVYNPAGEPPGGRALVEAAAHDVQMRTGLKFAFEGDTAEVAAFDRHPIQAQYGERFAPVVIGWSDQDATPELAGSVAGLGGSSAVPASYGDDQFLAAGVVVLDAPDFAEIGASLRGRSVAQAIIQHEIAHVVGLGHVDDEAELMAESNYQQATWGPGDQAGLAIAGAGPCQD
jgi:hypothetical protein